MILSTSEFLSSLQDDASRGYPDLGLASES